MSDSNEEEKPEEKPKNQSIAQVIYAENRVSLYFKHRMSHSYTVTHHKLTLLIFLLYKY